MVRGGGAKVRQFHAFDSMRAGVIPTVDIIDPSCWINRVAPTSMVMCPCVDGLSHNEDEEISQDWASAGANVLFHAVVETAEIVE